MLTGRRTFAGDNTASVMAAILEREPPRLDVGPAGLDHVMRRCLAKDPDERWQSVKDLRSELEWTRAQSEPAGGRRTNRGMRWAAAVALMAMLVLVLARPWQTRQYGTPQVVRLTVALPEEDEAANPVRPNQTPAISPDGKTVIIPLGSGAREALWMRRLDSDRFGRLRDLRRRQGAHLRSRPHADHGGRAHTRAGYSCGAGAAQLRH